MIDQKYVLQLIGDWGYTPSSLEKYIITMSKRAHKAGDAIGSTMYASLLSMCRYAMSADSHEALVKPNASVVSDEEMREKINRAIGDMMENSELADTVINSVYETCSSSKNLEDAERALRTDVIMTVSPLILHGFVESAADTASRVMQCFVSADEKTIAASYDDIVELKRSAELLDKFAEKICNYGDRIQGCKETDNYAFNEAVNAILGDVNDVRQQIQQPMMSVLDMPPDAWLEYSASFGKMMAGFGMAMAFGLITYDEVDDIVNEFVETTSSMFVGKTGKSSKKVSFGRN